MRPRREGLAKPAVIPRPFPVRAGATVQQQLTGAKVLRRIEIGAYARIGVNAVIVKDVEGGGTPIG
jgi:serine acetyltransferase